MTRLRFGCLIASIALLSACGTAPQRSPYYQNDGPPMSDRSDLESIPDAVPQVEPLRSANARPYEVMGRRYVPMTDLRRYKERGLASWYGKQFHNGMTASGERYDMFAMTAAHKTLPIPSYARVTNTRNGRSVIVRINDRGPFHDGRIVDLSYAAAVRLAGRNVGTQDVEVELLLPEEIARLRNEGSPRAAAGPQLATAAPVVAPANVETAAIVDASVVAASPLPATAPAASAAPMQAVESSAATNNAAPGDANDTANTAADRPKGAAPSASAAPFAVQAGAFSSRANAEALRGRIERERSAWTGRVNVVEAAMRFRVQLGPYLERAQALADADLLKRLLKVEGFVVDARQVDAR